MEKNDIVMTETETDEGGSELVLKLSKPYSFDGKEYTELDLSGLERVTAATLENIGRVVLKSSPEQVSTHAPARGQSSAVTPVALIISLT